MGWFKVNPDGSEQLEYTMEDLPVRATGGSLSASSGYAAACHWHNDFEMLTVPEGEMDYFVNGRTVHLRQGEGIFVNARRLHYGFSAEQRDCRYRFVVWHPNVMVDTPAVRRVMDSFAADESTDFWLFAASSEAVMLFHELYAAATSGNVLLTLAKCAELTEAVRAYADNNQNNPMRSEWIVIRNMTGYIQANYTQRITLEQIAAAGSVCRNRCCILFRENLGCSPIEYVTRYRLDKACDMLRQGHSITDTALSNGFHGASYFSEVFRRAYAMTPREYQRNAGQ